MGKTVRKTARSTPYVTFRRGRVSDVRDRINVSDPLNRKREADATARRETFDAESFKRNMFSPTLRRLRAVSAAALSKVQRRTPENPVPILRTQVLGKPDTRPFVADFRTHDSEGNYIGRDPQSAPS